MGDMMTFPDTVEEFMEQYKIVDEQKIYTNGTELVPIFRMEQWFEHRPDIITCKECKYSHMTVNGECKYCDIWFPDEKCYVSGDHYCGSAERREDGNQYKMQIVIDDYFKSECDINTSIRSAFEKGFRIGVKKASPAQTAIIHCRDCKHYHFADNRIPQEQRYTCDLDGDRWQPDSFCSCAERREE